MRARGAKVTDIAVLVVAADDGVMPQTRESIAHARAAEVPIVVAVNKIDLPDANPERVLGDLAAEGLQPEEWGGDTQVARVSAREQTGLDELSSKVLLVADAELELQANPKADASGPIIESQARHRPRSGRDDARSARDAPRRRRRRRRRRLGQGAGALQLQGREAQGREARAIRSRSSASTSRRLPASSPGWSRTDRDARDLAQKRAERLRREQFAIRPSSSVSLESLFDQLQAGEVKDLNLVVKGDVQGSIEAIVGELTKIQHPEVRVNVIHQGVGGITENDVMLASASGGMVLGFNVRPNAETRAVAEREGVEIRTYNVIYQLTEDIQQALVGMLTAVTTEETIGEAEVRETFRASRVGTIAGCMVTSGLVRRGANVRIVRDGTVIYTTTIDSLKRFQDDAREVQEGFECGIHLANYDDVKVGDVLEVFETREIERTSLDQT